MADVTRVGKGGPGPEEPSGPKRKKKGDTEAFKEMMKVGKVRETDPEEKRNRKRQAEVEEEMKGDLAAQAPQQGLPPPQAPSPGFQIPSSGGAVEGAQGPSPAGGAVPSAPPEEEPGEEPPSPPETQQQQPTPQTQGQQTQPSRPATQKKQLPEGTEHNKIPGTVAPKKEAEIKKGKEEHIPFQPEKTPLKKEEKKEAVKFEEEIEEPPLPPGAWEAIKEPAKKQEAASVTPQTAAPLPTAIPVSPTAPPPPLEPIASPFAHLPLQVAQIFDRMVGVMTVMHETGIKETTITLNNPQFAKSQFFGAQIIITEFSTAPREYNIQLLGNQQAVTTFQNNQEELVAAFQAGNYNFKVNRLETGYLTAPESVKRKETKRVTRKKKGDM